MLLLSVHLEEDAALLDDDDDDDDHARAYRGPTTDGVSV